MQACGGGTRGTSVQCQRYGSSGIEAQYSMLIHIGPMLGSAWAGSPNRGSSGPVYLGGHCPDSEGPTDTTLIPSRGKDSVTLGT